MPLKGKGYSVGKPVSRVGGNTPNTTPINKVNQLGGNSSNTSKPSTSDKMGGNYCPHPMNKMGKKGM